MTNRPSTIGEVRTDLWSTHAPDLPEMSWDMHCSMFDKALKVTTNSINGLAEAYEPLFQNLQRTYISPGTVAPTPVTDLQVALGHFDSKHAEMMAAVKTLADRLPAPVPEHGPGSKPITIGLDLAEITVLLDTLIASIHSSDHHYDLRARRDVATEVLKKLRDTNVQEVVAAVNAVLPTTSSIDVPPRNA